MPDRQMPPAPEGCRYGPWRDQWYWLCVAPWKSITGTVLASHMWDGKQWQRCTEACEPELLRLAKENQDLVAEVAALKAFVHKSLQGYETLGHEYWTTEWTDPEEWANEARQLVGESSISHEDAMKEVGE